MNLTDESFANTSMQTLNISNSEWENIKGFNNNSNLRNLTFNATTITNFDQNTFANSGYSSQFEVYLTNGSNINNFGGFANSKISKLDVNHSTITTIVDNAFSSSRYLKIVNITNSSNVSRIGQEAFMNCSNLVSLNMDNSSTVSRIEDRAFRSCNLGSTFNLTNNITTIGNDAFNSTSLRNAIIPTNLTLLGTGVYGNCRQNASVDFRNNNHLNFVPARTFYNNDSLKNVNLPSRISSIGEMAFMIESYSSTSNNPGISTINFNNITSLSNSCFKNSAISSFVANANLTNIPTSAFENCTSMTNLDLALMNRFSVSERAFYNTPNITNRASINGMTTIGTSAFEESGIAGHGWYNNDKPIQVSSIGSRAFYHCERMDYFPFCGSKYVNSSFSIGENAFARANLSNVGQTYTNSGQNKNKVPSRATTIGNYAFASSGFPNVSFDTFEANISTIPSYCFQSIGDSEYNTNDSTVFVDNWKLPWTSIGSYAFEGANNIRRGSGNNSILLNQNNANSANITRIGSYAFANIKKMVQNIRMGRVETIDDHAFYDTDIFTIVNDGNENVYWGTSVGNYAFAHSDYWNNNVANSIRIDGSECYLGTFINRIKNVGDYAFNNIGGTAPNNIYSYPTSVKRRIMVWNQDRYGTMVNVGAYAFENNMFDRDPGSGHEGNGHWPSNIITINEYGFYSVFVADNTSFITPYGVREFQDNNKVVTIRTRAFNNFAIFEYDTGNYFKFAISLRNVGISAFTAQYKTDKYMARAEFSNNQRYTLTNTTWDNGVNVEFVNQSHNIPIKFNDAGFPRSQENLVLTIRANFRSQIGSYYFY